MSQVNVNPPPAVEPPAPADGTGIGFIVGILVAILIIALLVWFLLISPGNSSTPANNTGGGSSTPSQTIPSPSGTRLVELV